MQVTALDFTDSKTEHGTWSGRCRGCDCFWCHVAAAEYMRDYRARVKAGGIFVDGVEVGRVSEVEGEACGATPAAMSLAPSVADESTSDVYDRVGGDGCGASGR